MRALFTVSRVALAAAALVFATGAASAGVTLNANDKNQINRCVSYMLTGPKYEGLEFKGEGFNCKPVTARIEGDHLVISGQLSHQLTWRPDDQVNFTFEFARDGSVTRSEVKVEDGGLVKVINWLKDSKIASLVIDKIPYGSSALNAADWVGQKAAAKINAGWTGYSDLMLLALQAKVSYGLAHADRIGVESFFIDRPGGDLGKTILKMNGAFAGVKITEKAPATWVEACEALCRADNACGMSLFITTTKACLLKSQSAGAPQLYDRGVSVVTAWAGAAHGAVIRDHRTQ